MLTYPLPSSARVFKPRPALLAAVMLGWVMLGGVAGCGGSSGGGGGADSVRPDDMTGPEGGTLSGGDALNGDGDDGLGGGGPNTEGSQDPAPDPKDDGGGTVDANVDPNDPTQCEDVPPECLADGDCPPGEVCDPNGECVVPDPGFVTARPNSPAPRFLPAPRH